jgi:hypothetical protein
MKNIPQAYLSTIVLVVLTTANFGGLISAGTIHDLRWVKVPGTGPLWNPWYLGFGQAQKYGRDKPIDISQTVSIYRLHTGKVNYQTVLGTEVQNVTRNRNKDKMLYEQLTHLYLYDDL